MVLITGGSSDIAQPLITKILEETVLKLIITKHNSKHNNSNPRIIEITADLSSEEGINCVLNIIEMYNITHYIQLQGNALINDTIETTNFDDMLHTLNVNTLSSTMILSKLLPKMKLSGYGRIVLTSTASANHGGGRNSFSYGMSKHAISYIVKHLAKYYSKFGILTNAISPGFIKTKFHTDTLQRDVSFLEKRGKTVKVGYAGMPEDISELIFNTTFKNNFMSGEIIKVDGADFI